MSSLTSQRAFAAVAILICTSLGLAACGNSESSGTGTAPEPVEATPPPEKKFAVRQDAVKGFVDSARAEGSSLVLTGWAASSDLGQVAEFVAGKVGDKTVGESIPTVERGDVAAFYGKPALKQSGFELRIADSALDCEKPAAGLKVFGVLNGNGSVLPMVEDTKSELEQAC